MSEFWNKRYSNLSYNHLELCEVLKDYINKIPKNNVVLDYGCGTGRVCDLLSNQVDKFIGYDISNFAISRSSNLNLTNSINQIRHLKFDNIICHRVLHSVVKKERDNILNYFYDSLNNNGSLFVSVRSDRCQELKEMISNKKFKKLEENTHENIITKKYIHFFNNQEILDLFSHMNIEQFGIFQELSGKVKKNNCYYYIIAKKFINFQ